MRAVAGFFPAGPCTDSPARASTRVEITQAETPNVSWGPYINDGQSAMHLPLPLLEPGSSVSADAFDWGIDLQAGRIESGSSGGTISRQPDGLFVIDLESPPGSTPAWLGPLFVAPPDSPAAGASITSGFSLILTQTVSTMPIPPDAAPPDAACPPSTGCVNGCSSPDVCTSAVVDGCREWFCMRPI